MNILDYVILLGLAIWLITVVIYIVRQKRAGGCIGCSEAGQCMMKDTLDKKQQMEKCSHKDRMHFSPKKHLS